MNCADFKSQLIDYLDGRLSPALSGGVESHLESCPACRCEVELHRRAWELAGRIDAIEPGPSFGAAVRRRVRRPRIAAIVGSCAAAAALAVALLVPTGKNPAVPGETESAWSRMPPEDRRLLEELARDRTWELADNMEVVRAFEVLEGNGVAALPEEDH